MIFNKYKIEELGTVFSGGTPSTKNSEYWDGSVPWITPKDLSGYNSKYIGYGERNITEFGLKKSSATLIPQGSVLMSSRAPIGYVAISNNDVTTNQGFKSVCCNEKICLNEYMYYWIKNNLDYIKSKANGSTFKEISGSSFKNLEVSVPSIEEQKKIIKILSLLDNKIETNYMLNNNLFSFLKTKFRKDFYIKDNNGVRLSELIDYTIGGDWGKDELVGNYNTEVYCVRGADIPNMEYGDKGNAPKRFVLEKNYINKKLESNDIIVEISGGSPTQSTGRTAYITQEILDMYNSPLLCTNFCRAIKLKKVLYAPFAYMFFKLMYEDNEFFSWENGTTGIKNFDLTNMIENVKVKLPANKDLEKFNELFNSIMKQISLNSKEIQLFIESRDTLLPALMNGEIDLDKIEI